MITQRQIAAVKYLVARSIHGSQLVKQIFFYLVDKSYFTHPVALTLHENDGWGADEIHKNATTWKAMTSSNQTLHLNEILRAMGSEFSFNIHYGAFREDGEFDTTGQLVGFPPHAVLGGSHLTVPAPMRYTFWLAPGFYPSDVEVFRVTREELEHIDISRGILYEE